MGSACAKSSNANQNPHPVPPIHHNQNIERPPNTRQAQLQNIMNTDYASHLNIEHGLNINHKFADYFTIISKISTFYFNFYYHP